MISNLQDVGYKPFVKQFNVKPAYFNPATKAYSPRCLCSVTIVCNYYMQGRAKHYASTDRIIKIDNKYWKMKLNKNKNHYQTLRKRYMYNISTHAQAVNITMAA